MIIYLTPLKFYELKQFYFLSSLYSIIVDNDQEDDSFIYMCDKNYRCIKLIEKLLSLDYLKIIQKL